jgi:hypothetical protein
MKGIVLLQGETIVKINRKFVKIFFSREPGSGISTLMSSALDL